MKHPQQSPLAGKSIAITSGDFAGEFLLVEDWWDRVVGRSWMVCDGNPACLEYAVRGAGRTPIDDEVVYGKIGSLGKLIHVSELATVE